MQPTVIIDFKEILSGVGIADRVPTTGISSESKGINVDYEKGVLHFQKAPSERGIVISDQVIAKATDYGVFTNQLYMLDASKKFYKMDASYTISNVLTGVSKTYQYGTSDMVQFKGNFYATSTTDVAKINGAFTVLTEDWWTTTMGKPSLDNSAGFYNVLEVVEDKMYIANNYHIHSFDGTTAVVDSMQVPSTQIITFMIKHPNGRDLIVFTTERMNFSGTLQAINRVYVFDLFKQSFIEEHMIDDQVNAGIVIGGTLYVTYGGNKLGYFNGQGIAFLRDLNYAIGTYTHTKCKLANMQGALLVGENDQVLVLRNLGAGAAYYYPMQNDTGYAIDMVVHLGSKQIFTTGREINGGSYVSLRYDLTQRGYAGRLVTDWIKLPANAWIRRIQVEHNYMSAASYDMRLATYQTEFGGQIYPATGTTVSDWRYNVKASEVQLRIKPMYGTPMGIRRIILYCEVTDE